MPPSRMSCDVAVVDYKGQGRIKERRVSVLCDLEWLIGKRRFPGELRLPDAACLIRVEIRVQLGDKSRADMRY